MSTFYHENLSSNGGNKELALSQAIDRSLIERFPKPLLEELAQIAGAEGLQSTYISTANTFLIAYSGMARMKLSVHEQSHAEEFLKEIREGE